MSTDLLYIKHSVCWYAERDDVVLQAVEFGGLQRHRWRIDIPGLMCIKIEVKTASS
jgi:hypothetical protein